MANKTMTFDEMVAKSLSWRSTKIKDFFAGIKPGEAVPAPDYLSLTTVRNTCGDVLPDDGQWFVLGIREPKPPLKSMFMLFDERKEPEIAEFCTTTCTISYLMAAREVVRD